MGKLEIQTPQGAIAIERFQENAVFAWHREVLSFPGEKLRSGRMWALTHKGSGWKVASFSLKEDAEEAANALLDVPGWQGCQTAEELNARIAKDENFKLATVEILEMYHRFWG